ncbi:MAG: DUF4432 domain-containing protein [Meiothermus sp.]
MNFSAMLHLHPSLFGERERVLAEFAGLRAVSFLYPSGVAALRLEGEAGRMTLLPFHGQQIWRLELFGRELAMKSLRTEPSASRVYLENYGAFLLHCGLTAMGAPGPADTHPLHGELPHASYQTAQLVIGEDERGAYMGLSGTYEHTVSFKAHYLARPLVRLYQGSGRVPLSMEVENLGHVPMELMYMAHLNFRPVNGARLEYSARATPEHVRVRTNLPAHVSPTPEHRAFLDALAQDPTRHHVLEPGLAFDPEVVLYIDYRAALDGWAHSLQLLPTGSADFVSHRPEQLGKGVRWICRTPDQDALGLNLPSTAEPEGYTAEKAKGNVQQLAARAKWRCDLEVGVLEGNELEQMRAKIAQTLRS